MDKEEEKKMDDVVARYFTCLGGIFVNLLTYGMCSLVSGNQNDIAVS